MDNNEAAYAARLKRVREAIELKTPDKVPFLPFFTYFPATYSGVSFAEVMRDYDTLARVWKKVIIDFQPDMYNPFIHIAFGPMAGILKSKQFQWAGNNYADDRSFQFVEGEYMRVAEYDEFLFDPTDFMLRKFLPRTFGALEPFSNLFDLPSVYYTRFMTSAAIFATPEVGGAFASLCQAGARAQKYTQTIASFTQEMARLGFPSQFGSMAYAPFDYIGDLFRGMRGIMLDMFRVPEKLLEVLEKATPIVVRGAKNASQMTGNPNVFMPLHKGIDSFMSLDQFSKFYWPTLKKTLLSFIDAGMTPWVFWEGNVESRLEIIEDIPKGKAVYWFEQTDIFKAKEVLGKKVCLRGNLPASLLCLATPPEVDAYCRRLIEKVGRDGGFIMDGGAGIPDEAKPENVQAMVEAVNTYGRS